MVEIRERVNTTIDAYLKAAFEATADIHHKSFPDIIEESIIKILEDVTPLDHVKLTISKMELELSELKSLAAELEVLEKQKKLSKKVEQEDTTATESYLEDFRHKKFSEHIESALKMLRKGGQPNWKNMAPLYQFSNEKDFKQWFFDKMSSEQIQI